MSQAMALWQQEPPPSRKVGCDGLSWFRLSGSAIPRLVANEELAAKAEAMRTLSWQATII